MGVLARCHLMHTPARQRASTSVWRRSLARSALHGLDHGRRRLLAVALSFLVAVALACSSSTVSPTPPPRRAPAEAPALDASATALPAQSTSRDSVATVASPAAGEDPIPPIVQELNPSGPKAVALGAFRQLLGRDRIRPVYSPLVVTPDMAALVSDDLVIGVSMGGESRAYPIRPLRFHEMVKTSLGAHPFWLRGDRSATSRLVHDRRVDGETLTFGNQGALFMNAMTWWDHDTESVWSQPWGSAIRGPLEGTALTLIPASIVPWPTWLDEHPDTADRSPAAG